MDSNDIKRLKELAEKATPGPWAQHPQAPKSVHQPEYQCWIPALDTDAELISAMFNALPALLAAWEDAERFKAWFQKHNYDLWEKVRSECTPASSVDDWRAAIDAAMGDKP